LRDIQKLIAKNIPVIQEHPFLANANAAAPPPQARPPRQQSQQFNKPKRNNFQPQGQSQGSANGNHVRRGYSQQRSGSR